MVRDSFAIFILSHGRADRMVTVNTILKEGYTGKWYIILDTDDEQYDLYVSNFGKEHIILFDKKDIKKEFDIMDNFEGDNVPTFARNAVNRIAKNMGLEYFLELEDDYYKLCFRCEMDNHLPELPIENLDLVIEAMLDFLDKTGLKTVAFAQAGEMIGGKNGIIWKTRIRRKVMNTFFFRVDNTFDFLGRFNDDVNAYITYGKTGDVMLQIANITLDQPVTQQRKGGISEAYKSFGTYVKSFYSVMLRPDCVKIAVMGRTDRRIHHKIDWKYCVPVIISDRFRKE